MFFFFLNIYWTKLKCYQKWYISESVAEAKKKVAKEIKMKHSQALVKKCAKMDLFNNLVLNGIP